MINWPKVLEEIQAIRVAKGLCNNCGRRADLGVTCSGLRCKQCGCDKPKGGE
jgi:hypothetical protein